MLIAPGELGDWLVDGAELALLDAREQGVFCQSHLFHAACLPSSRVDIDLARLVPNPDVRLVWCDGGGDGLAARAASVAERLGYTNVSVLDGGTEAWALSGRELYSGVNVPSKAFGEYVEHTYDTPRIPAAELMAMLDDDTDLVVLDSRPVEEYRRMSIPTGIDCPGAELVHRAKGMAPDPSTLVVVNCAGRTRSIIGAQSLINAGLPNKVVALENGTMGWELAGLSVESGRTRYADSPSAADQEWAAGAARSVGERFGVRSIDTAGLRGLCEDTSRTTFVLDVRTPEEFLAGHLPGSRLAPGGQLVQATDEYVGVRNAQVVLVDDNGVRATMTASWLRQLGFDDAVVLAGGLDGDLAIGSEPIAPLSPEVPLTTVVELQGALDRPGTAVLDLATSLAYRAKGHVPGAWWGVRSRLDDVAAKFDAEGVDCSSLVITSFDDDFARFAFADVAGAFPDSTVTVLDGGTREWIAQGRSLDVGFERATSTPDDVWYKPYDLVDEKPPEDDMQAYLTWEVALVEQLERDTTVRFPVF